MKPVRRADRSGTYCGFDAAKGKALLAEAGHSAQKPLSFKVMISTSGSGQMLPLPMNESEALAPLPGIKILVPDGVQNELILEFSTKSMPSGFCPKTRR
jgi:hypothetical protein